MGALARVETDAGRLQCCQLVIALELHEQKDRRREHDDRQRLVQSRREAVHEVLEDRALTAARTD
jgi:hypothetical protein